MPKTVIQFQKEREDMDMDLEELEAVFDEANEEGDQEYGYLEADDDDYD